MTDPRFVFTDRAKPIVQIGLGDRRIEGDEAAFWDVTEWDDPTALWGGVQPLWLDISCHVIETEGTYGRRSSTEEFEPGTASLVVSNATGWADPVPPDDDPSLLTLRAGRPIRFGVDHQTLGIVWRWRGIIDDPSPRYDPTHGDVADITAVCALGEAGRADVPERVTPVGANELASSRIIRILDEIKQPSPLRSIAATGVHCLETTMGDSAANLLQIAAASAGGAVFGDTEGRVCFRGRDWQMFMADEPNDGTIGNIMTPGYIDLPVTAGNYLTVPRTAPADPDLEWRADFVRPPMALANGSYRAITGPPVWLFFYNNAGTEMLFAQMFFSDLTIVQAPIFIPGGFPAIGERAQARGVWDKVANTLTLEWRETDADLLDDTDAWTLGVTSAPVAKVGPTQTTWRLSESTATSSLASQLYRAVLFQDGERHIDVNPAVDLDGVDPAATTFVAKATGQTVTVTRAGSPDVELVASTLDGACPTSWHLSGARQNIITQVQLGRDGVDDEPFVYDDLVGQELNGIEPYTATDLVCAAEVDLDRIAQRTFETRGYQTSPRVDEVTLSAATSDQALDLMTTASVFEPSRYRCNLELERGEIFDREMLVVGITETMRPDEWRMTLTLDLADPWQASGGEWDGDGWDQCTWN